MPQRTSEKEERSVCYKIKAYIEIIEGKFKKRDDKKAAASDARKIIKKALKQFLSSLDKTFEKHEEAGDTDVRERIFDAIHKGFIKPRSNYVLPEKFGMFTNAGDRLIQVAIQTFLTHPEVSAASKSLKTPEARLDAFQDNDVESAEGNACFEYFGYSTKPHAD